MDRWTAPIFCGFIGAGASTYYLMTPFNTVFSNGTVTPKLDGTSTAINQGVTIFTASAPCTLNQLTLWMMQRSGAGRTLDVEGYKYPAANGATAWPVGVQVIPLTTVTLTTSGAIYQQNISGLGGNTFATGDRLVLTYHNNFAGTTNTSVTGTVEFQHQ